MLLLWFLCLIWVLSAADRCLNSHSTHSASPLLNSLQCYNDFQSYFHCKWREEPKRQSNGRLKLWLQAKRGRLGLCENYISAEDGFSECRYETRMFSIGTTYTAYFEETVSHCSGRTTSLDLSMLLRARAPVNLTTSNTDDGGRLITWSSPYPQSSALNNNITYQLSYKPDSRDDWTMEELSDNQKKLEKNRMTPGHRYEARVRARVRMGQWSHWSPSVSWHILHDVDTAPPVDCVVWGEQEVQCRWEQSIDSVHFISYNLGCRHNPTGPLKLCCTDPAVLLEHREDSVRFSCFLTLAEPRTTSLQVELVPTRSIKIFSPHLHILPYPPTHVKVTEKGIVTWTPPQMAITELHYEVCYYSLKMENVKNVCSDSRLVNQNSKDVTVLYIPKGSSSVNIMGPTLLPSHKYLVQVRTRVLPQYKGMPSDWTAPVEWTSQAEAWPIYIWIYLSLGALSGLVFLMLIIVPACRRRSLLWVESLPSPGKSKVILDIQTLPNQKVILSQNTYCKALNVDSVSTWSSDVSLWSTKSTDPRQVEKEEEAEEEEVFDDGIWSCDNMPVSPLDASSMSFTGPYIFCQAVESNPVEDISEQTEVSCPDVECVSTLRTVSFEEGYVCLPSHTVCRSVPDLTSQNHSDTEEELSISCTEDQLRLSEEYTSETFWPQGGATQGSGYCQLPAGFSST